MFNKIIGGLTLSLFLVACGGAGDSADTSTADSSDAASEPAAVVEEAVTESRVAPSPEAGILGHCENFGPQTPRDITSTHGTNIAQFDFAPASNEMNLCNIHTHTHAEHKGPGFSVFVGDAEDGGFACNNADSLTADQLAPSEGAYKGVEPGETIEVHWVHSSCDITPGEGLGACLTETCTDPVFRVEAQVFLVVNDENAMDFTEMAYGGNMINGLHQPKNIPNNTGEPVVFHGSTTGPSYDDQTCSPFEVTWSVRPQCAMLDINSLHRWAEDNPFNESKSHGVRELVTEPGMLSPIESAGN